MVREEPRADEPEPDLRHHEGKRVDHGDVKHVEEERHTSEKGATWTLGANRTKVRRAWRLRPPRAFSTKSVLSSRPPRNPENRVSLPLTSCGSRPEIGRAHV